MPHGPRSEEAGSEPAQPPPPAKAAPRRARLLRSRTAGSLSPLGPPAPRRAGPPGPALGAPRRQRGRPASPVSMAAHRPAPLAQAQDGGGHPAAGGRQRRGTLGRRRRLPGNGPGRGSWRGGAGRSAPGPAGRRPGRAGPGAAVGPAPEPPGASRSDGPAAASSCAAVFPR